ncbi:MAG TPA: PQQ-dependent sugar dehydrogenase, partial [Polyangiaceae bacterium]|nr:PQQ-dependent sugar dehydrogenase [Polyangiaceae bacterium]
MRSTYGWMVAVAGLWVSCAGDDDWPGTTTTTSTSTGGMGGSSVGGAASTTAAVGGSAGGAGDASGGATSGAAGGSSSGGASTGAAGGSGGASGGASGAGGDGTGVPSPVPGTEGFNCEGAVGAVPTLRLVEVAGDFSRPLFVTFAPGDASRLFVVEQSGIIRVIEDGELVAEPFLDLTDSVEIGGNEQGLLGLAFHPDYADNGRFYVNYTAQDGVHGVLRDDTIVSEFSVGSDPNVAEVGSERVVLTQAQPERNHNGGMLAFGPDGFLYIGLGDGGGGNDPDGNGQDTSTWLGKILRIDIDASDAGEYGIPSGNMPSPAAPEIFHYGLRNPWRFSFDGCRGDLYLGDVGQNDWEELNVV